MSDPYTHLRVANDRRGVFLRVFLMFRKPPDYLHEGKFYLTCWKRPFLAYYAVRCLLWEG